MPKKLVPPGPEPALRADCVLEDPCDETECDDADDNGIDVDPAPMGGAHSVGNADADDLDGVLTGCFISMFSLRIDSFCSFN